MREIKFRALKDDMSNCTFQYGQLVYKIEEISGKKYPSITSDGQIFTSCLLGTESQYTGLKDKNGREIYEGDIVVFDSEKYVIKYSYASFGLENKEGDFKLPITALTIYCSEVIGNIYEHKNLLDKL